MLKVCRYCKESKDLNDFPYFSTSKAGRKNTCKSCTQKLKKVRSQLKLQYPPPGPGSCPICHQLTDVWILDHCHFTDTFRGYICNSCNLGIGRFNDDVELLESAITYLKTLNNS